MHLYNESHLNWKKPSLRRNYLTCILVFSLFCFWELSCHTYLYTVYSLTLVTLTLKSMGCMFGCISLFSSWFFTASCSQKKAIYSNSVWLGADLDESDYFTTVILVATYAWMACVTGICVEVPLLVLCWTDFQTMQCANSSSHRKHHWCADRESGSLPGGWTGLVVAFNQMQTCSYIHSLHATCYKILHVHREKTYLKDTVYPCGEL